MRISNCHLHCLQLRSSRTVKKEGQLAPQSYPHPESLILRSPHPVSLISAMWGPRGIPCCRDYELWGQWEQLWGPSPQALPCSVHTSPEAHDEKPCRHQPWSDVESKIYTEMSKDEIRRKRQTRKESEIGKREKGQREVRGKGEKKMKMKNQGRRKSDLSLPSLQCLSVSAVFCSHSVSLHLLLCPCVSYQLSGRFTLCLSLSLALP